MKIKDIMKYIRNITFVIMYKDEGFRSAFVDDLEEHELELTFEWFEVKQFKGRPCIEFNNCQ